MSIYNQCQFQYGCSGRPMSACVAAALGLNSHEHSKRKISHFKLLLRLRHASSEEKGVPYDSNFAAQFYSAPRLRGGLCAESVSPHSRCCLPWPAATTPSCHLVRTFQALARVPSLPARADGPVSGLRICKCSSLSGEMSLPLDCAPTMTQAPQTCGDCQSSRLAAPPLHKLARGLARLNYPAQHGIYHVYMHSLDILHDLGAGSPSCTMIVEHGKRGVVEHAGSIRDPEFSHDFVDESSPKGGPQRPNRCERPGSNDCAQGTSKRAFGGSLPILCAGRLALGLWLLGFHPFNSGTISLRPVGRKGAPTRRTNVPLKGRHTVCVWV